MLTEPKSILITGGAGSLGTKLSEILVDDSRYDRVIIYSRDWHKQEKLKKLLNSPPKFRWFIGDVSDRQRLNIALRGMNYIIHAAALKSVDVGEYNPSEVLKTNIFGTEQVIQAATQIGIEKVLVISSDKACNAVNAYGRSKAMAESLAVAYNSYAPGRTEISVSRYGNVIGSSGSVVPIFDKLAEANLPIDITDYQMTRFWITLEQAAKFVLSRLDDMRAGDIYIPKLRSASIYDVIKVIQKKHSSTAEIYEIGIRPGEKLHEILFSREEARHVYMQDDYYYIFPEIHLWDRNRAPTGTLYTEDKEYSSHKTTLSMDELESLIYG